MYLGRCLMYVGPEQIFIIFFPLQYEPKVFVRSTCVSHNHVVRRVHGLRYGSSDGIRRYYCINFYSILNGKRCVPHQTQRSIQLRKSYTRKVTSGTRRDDHSQPPILYISYHTRPFITIIVVVSIAFHVCIVTTTTTTATDRM